MTGTELVTVGMHTLRCPRKGAQEVAWDEEHTLGARIRDGRLVELNGSVLRP